MNITKKVLIDNFNKETGELKLIKKNINDQDIETINQYILSTPGVSALNLQHNQISDTGAACLATIPGIITLDLRDNLITDIGAKALSYSINIVNLVLFDNPIGEQGKQALKQCTEHRKVNNTEQKMALLMGTYSGDEERSSSKRRKTTPSPILEFSKDPIFDKNILTKIFKLHGSQTNPFNYYVSKPKPKGTRISPFSRRIKH
jgi:hypothetical protein